MKKRLSITIGLVVTALGLIVVTGFVAAPARPATTPAVASQESAPPVAYPEQVLQSAVSMTQQMSAPGAMTGHEYHGHEGDSQLQLAQSPGFAQAVADYQAQLDRSLARSP